MGLKMRRIREAPRRLLDFSRVRNYTRILFHFFSLGKSMKPRDEVKLFLPGSVEGKRSCRAYTIVRPLARTCVCTRLFSQTIHPSSRSYSCPSMLKSRESKRGKRRASGRTERVSRGAAGINSALGIVLPRASEEIRQNSPAVTRPRNIKSRFKLFSASYSRRCRATPRNTGALNFV